MLVLPLYPSIPLEYEGREAFPARLTHSSSPVWRHRLDRHGLAARRQRDNFAGSPEPPTPAPSLRSEQPRADLIEAARTGSLVIGPRSAAPHGLGGWTSNPSLPRGRRGHSPDPRRCRRLPGEGDIYRSPSATARGTTSPLAFPGAGPALIERVGRRRLRRRLRLVAERAGPRTVVSRRHIAATAA